MRYGMTSTHREDLPESLNPCTANREIPCQTVWSVEFSGLDTYLAWVRGRELRDPITARHAREAIESAGGDPAIVEELVAALEAARIVLEAVRERDTGPIGYNPRGPGSVLLQVDSVLARVKGGA